MLQVYLLLSVIAASGMQIGKIIGRFADIPNATLAFAGTAERTTARFREDDESVASASEPFVLR